MKTLTDITFWEVIRGNDLVLVDFSAQWCNPCKLLGRLLEDLLVEYKDKVLFTKIDVDEHKRIVSEFGIMSVPTLILFNKGEEIERSVGLVSEEEIRKMLDRNLNG